MSYRAGSSHRKTCTLCLQRDGYDRQAVVFKRWLVDVQLVLMGTVSQVSPILLQHQQPESLIDGRKKNEQTPHRKDTGFEPCEAKRPDNIFPLFHCPTLASAVSSVSCSQLTGVASNVVICFYSPFVSRRNVPCIQRCSSALPTRGSGSSCVQRQLSLCAYQSTCLCEVILQSTDVKSTLSCFSN